MCASYVSREPAPHSVCLSSVVVVLSCRCFLGPCCPCLGGGQAARPVSDCLGDVCAGLPDELVEAVVGHDSHGGHFKPSPPASPAAEQAEQKPRRKRRRRPSDDEITPRKKMLQYLLRQSQRQLAAAEMRANTDQQQSLAEKSMAMKQVVCLCR